MSEYPEWEDGWGESEDGDCWNCGGEGFVSNCFEEYACIDPEGGCDACERRCEVCNPKPTKAVMEFRQVLSDALTKATEGGRG